MQAALSATLIKWNNACPTKCPNAEYLRHADNSLAIVKPYKVQTEGVVSGNPSYFDFIAPA
jgi:hypothetical protein